MLCTPHEDSPFAHEKVLETYTSDSGIVSFLVYGSGVETWIGGVCIESVRFADLPRLRWAVAHWVAEAKVLNKRQAKQIFQCSPMSVQKWVRAFESHGLPGLLGRGPGRPREIPSEVRRRIVALRRSGETVEKTVEIVRAEFDLQTLDTGMVARISREARERGEHVAVSTDPWPGCGDAGTIDGDLVELFDESGTAVDGSHDASVPSDTVDSGTSETASPDADADASPVAEVEGAPSIASEVVQAASVASEVGEAAPVEVEVRAANALVPMAVAREAAYETILQAGTQTSYAGGYLLAGLIAQLGLVAILQDLGARVREEFPPREEDNRFWDLSRVFLMVVYAYVLRFGSIEGLKTAHRRSLGLLVGAPSCPGLALTRKMFWQAANLELGRPLSDMLTAAYIRLGWVQMATLYIDGHFRPYYGHHRLARGWFAGRNRPHPGFYEYVVNATDGRPVLLRLSDAATHMTEVLPALVDDVLAHCKEAGIKKAPVIVFDRGAFSAELFAELDRRHVPFVTYMKGATQTYPDGLFSETVWVKDTKRCRRFKYLDTKVSVTGYGENIRAIVVLDPAKGRQMTIITNADRVRPPDASGKEGRRRLDSKKLIQLMLGRWTQENFFKNAKANVALDQLATRGAIEAPAEGTIPNPERKAIRTRRSTLERRLAEVNEALAQLEVPRPKGTRRQSRDKALGLASQRQLVAERKSLLRAVADLVSERAQTPSRLSQKDLPPETRNAVLNLQHQFVFENLKICSHNLFQMLLAEFRGVYPDKRDPAPVLRYLMKQPARVQCIDGVLHVSIETPSIPRHAAALEALLEIMQDTNPTTTDSKALPIRFSTHTPSAMPITFAPEYPPIMDAPGAS